MPQIESLFLANHAEVHDGLLYLMGAGWDQVRQVVVPGQSPPPFHFGLGLSVLVGWTETNRRHHVSIRLEPEDGGVPVMSLEADLEVGRPPGALEGADQRSVMALSMDIVFPHPGGYRLAARMGDEARSASFRVVHDAVPGTIQRPA